MDPLLYRKTSLRFVLVEPAAPVTSAAMFTLFATLYPLLLIVPKSAIEYEVCAEQNDEIAVINTRQTKLEALAGGFIVNPSLRESSDEQIFSWPEIQIVTILSKCQKA